MEEKEIAKKQKNIPQEVVEEHGKIYETIRAMCDDAHLSEDRYESPYFSSFGGGAYTQYVLDNGLYVGKNDTEMIVSLEKMNKKGSVPHIILHPEVLEIVPEAYSEERIVASTNPAYPSSITIRGNREKIQLFKIR